MAETGVETAAQQKDRFMRVVDTLINIFGNALNSEALFAIVETCNGDTSEAAAAVTEIITNENNLLKNHNADVNSPQLPLINTMPSHELSSNVQELATPTPSYAQASTSRGAVPKQNSPRSNKTKRDSNPIWSEQFKMICNYHNKGYRTLIILRGVPGSGKSTLARQIVEMTVGSNYQDHVLSSDDYFYDSRGKYVYIRERLSQAHIWNKQRVSSAVQRGLSPVIVDNTNVKLWEMEDYVREGVKEGYYIEVLEPHTRWGRNASELSRKNSHNVPIDTIRRMLNGYEPCKSGNELLRHFGISYPAGKSPPVLRKYPKLESNVMEKDTSMTANVTQSCKSVPQATYDDSTKEQLNPPNSDNPSSTPNNTDQLDTKYVEVEKQIREFEQLEKEWDNGEDWDDQSSSNSRGPKNQKREINTSESLLSSVGENNDWLVTTYSKGTIVPTSHQNVLTLEPIKVETRDNGTCVEMEDNNLNKTNHKILTGTSRNINLYYVPKLEQIPNKRMLDKSSMTNEQAFLDNHKCDNETKHFNAFRKMFKNIPREDLRDIFDKCGGDANWASEIVLEGVDSNKIATNNDCESSDSETTSEHCQCNAKYDVIPDTRTEVSENNILPSDPVPQLLLPKKQKKPKPLSDKSIKLKREIEKNIVLADNFYSEHAIKIRRFRRGEPEVEEAAGGDIASEETVSSSDSEKDFTDDNKDTVSVEETLTFNLGAEFVFRLDKLFGRTGIKYPDNIVPLVSIPRSTLDQINALWIESLTHQLESQAEYTKIMMKEDEEFARQLHEKEQDLLMAGEEPAVPDFKEIMNMDFALTLVQREVLNNQPDDWAAKMTRDKLSNLFPDINKETLSEILMSHENHFQSTVETLLLSTGQSDILIQPNGVNKFVMEKEIARQAKIVEAEKKKQNEKDAWPGLPPVENVSMDAVHQYRLQAKNHLDKRTYNYHKAQDSMRRGMTQVATHYSEVAAFHKKMFEHNNLLAASTLIQINKIKNPDNTTVDLHHMSLNEAMSMLDMTLDKQINLLRESTETGPRRKLATKMYYITGRGKHSVNGAIVKPAARRRLRERGYIVSQVNPGLLSVTVSAHNLMTHQLSRP